MIFSKRFSAVLFLFALLSLSGCNNGEGTSVSDLTGSLGSETSDQGETVNPVPKPYNPGWYKGDLHTHSMFSDGDIPVKDVVAAAEDKGLDYFVLTDHNTNEQWSDDGYLSDKLTLLYGVEWTGEGHANIISSKPYDWNAIAPTVDAEKPGDAIAIAHSQQTDEQSVVFSINHPRADLCCGWKYSYEESKDADMMEVWNARYLIPNFNFLALSDTYASYLKKGKKITLVGGSDAHSHIPNDIKTLYNDIGNPTTWIYADSNEGEDILKALKKGHAFVSTSPKGPRLEFLADSGIDAGKPKNVKYDLMMGDSIPAESIGKDVFFMVRVFDATVPSVLSVIKNNKPVGKWISFSFSADYMFSFTDKPKKGDYYRVELRQLFKENPDNPIGELLQGLMAAITNPIYAW